MLNVASGNLIVQDDDVDVPERGVDLAFRRTYNSQSQHDYANTDGSTPSNYGNGWTNTFDAHIAYNTNGPTLSVYDVDGARYDYTVSNGLWIPPAGQHATLTSDGGCGYFWEKKNGTRYYFWSPRYNVCSNSNTAGYNGRLYEIQGRNRNNWVIFDYYWDNGIADSDAHITQINARHADGQLLTLQFTDVNQRRLLSALTRPDGQAIRFAYDGNANLTDVCDVGNGNTDGSPNAAGICGDTVHRHHRYGWNPNHQMAWADSPKWVMSWGGPNQSGSGGAYAAFGEDGSNRTTSVQYIGYANFRPNDGTNTLLQPGMIDNTNNAGVYRNLSFSYATDNSLFSDTDGHATRWYHDAAGRVTSTASYSGSVENIWLVSNASWDSANNLIATQDANGNETDSGYDAAGNTLWVQQPFVSTSVGRPVARYSYDQFNNLIAYCDPAFVAKTGITACTSGAGASYFQYDYSDTQVEPDGRLTSTQTPSGYATTIAYNTTIGDVGLPSAVSGQLISQNDGTQRQSQQTFGYDGNGNVTSYSKGFGSWSLTYDSLNRMTSATDPDGVTSRTCFNSDGSIAAKQSALQYSIDGAACGSHSVLLTYDADGNESSETHHFGQTQANSVQPGVTTKWYDGDDRLVEVLQPVDPTINTIEATSQGTSNGVPDPTRYYYDLTQNGSQGTLSIDGASGFAAHGNMFAAVLCIINYNAPNACSWDTTKAGAYDALDRQTTKFSYSPGTDAINGGTGGVTARQTTYLYDASVDAVGANGLLVSRTDANGIKTTLHYDHLGRTVEEDFSDGTAWKYLSYDSDGRVNTIGDSASTHSYTYDSDGRLATRADGGVGGGTLRYDYYPDGLRRDMVLQGGPIDISGQMLAQYAYRGDGRRWWLKANVANAPFAWAYTNAGRLTNQKDPYTGNTLSSGASLIMRTAMYDANGEIASLTMPSGATYANITHDIEGEISSYAAQYPGISTQPKVAISYDVRGEVNGRTVQSPYPASSPSGAFISQFDTNYGLQCTVKATYCGSNGDMRTGAQVAAGSLSCLTSTGSYTSAPVTIRYDAMGHLMEESGSCAYPSTVVKTLVTRQYDAEGHSLSDQCPGYQPATTSEDPEYVGCYPTNSAYTWDANGRVATLTNSSGTFSLHWDGASLLYVTDSNGTLVQENVEKFGTWTRASGTLTVRDRDYGGAIVSQHQAGAADQWVASPLMTYPRSGEAAVATFPAIGSGSGFADMHDPSGANVKRFLVISEILGMNHGDGYDDVNLVFQGVRAYDPSVGQWTTPDAYSGTIQDPGSQRSYMWNGNNPIAYSDPSGMSPLSSEMLAELDGVAYAGDATAAGAGDLRGSLAKEEISAIRAAVQLGKTSGFSSATAAAFGAAIKYTETSNQSSVEFGAPIYRSANGTFGFGDVTVGERDSVDTRLTGRPPGTTVVGIWHSHPYRNQVLDHTVDLENFKEANPERSFIFFTSVGGQLIEQDLSPTGHIGQYYVVCGKCVAVPMESDTF